MFRKVFVGASLALCIAACATSPSTPTGQKSATAENTPPRGCVSGTATRLPVRPGECAGFGNAWSEKDLKSTGATDVGQGLSLLDPSLTVTGPSRP
jgi:hypothetical protein